MNYKFNKEDLAELLGKVYLAGCYGFADLKEVEVGKYLEECGKHIEVHKIDYTWNGYYNNTYSDLTNTYSENNFAEISKTESYHQPELEITSLMNNMGAVTIPNEVTILSEENVEFNKDNSLEF